MKLPKGKKGCLVKGKVMMFCLRPKVGGSGKYCAIFFSEKNAKRSDNLSIIHPCYVCCPVMIVVKFLTCKIHNTDI